MHLSSLVLAALSHSRLPGLGKGQVKLTYLLVVPRNSGAWGIRTNCCRIHSSVPYLPSVRLHALLISRASESTALSHLMAPRMVLTRRSSG